MTGLNRIICVLAAVALAGCVDRNKPQEAPTADQVGEHLLPSVPAKMTARLDAAMSGGVTLLGYDVDRKEAYPGDEVQVTWYWKVDAAPGRGWRLFTHVIDGNGKSRINQDRLGPIRSHLQPEAWRPGMIIRDPQRVTIPTTWDSEKFELRVGMWKRRKRMRVKGHQNDGADRVRGPVIAIQPRPEMKVRAVRTSTPPQIDGRVADEALWQGAPEIGRFTTTLEGRRVERPTDVRVMWDDSHLYIAMRAADDHLKSEFENHDDELWKQDAFEVFLDPGGDRKDYFEVQISPRGVLFDSHLPTYRKNQNQWQSMARSAVALEGTLNDESDGDVAWSAELAIPLASLAVGGGDAPKAGDRWRVNFFRVDITKGKPIYTAWSPPMRGDFHALDRFGEMVFEDAAGAAAGDGGPPQPSEAR